MLDGARVFMAGRVLHGLPGRLALQRQGDEGSAQRVRRQVLDWRHAGVERWRGGVFPTVAQPECNS